jgi:hypothetical protein
VRGVAQGATTWKVAWEECEKKTRF